MIKVKSGFILMISMFLITASCNRNLVPEKVGTEVQTWQISKGKFQLNTQKNDPLGQQYWRKVTSILPEKLINQYITSFRLYTDGPSEDLGGMSPLDDSNTLWEIDLDTADFNLTNTDSAFVLNYTHTLIHEFGHLLTLNVAQVEPTEDQRQDDNKGYLTAEGYAREGSYLGKYVSQFWTEDFLAKWDKIDRIKKDSKRLDGFYDFYLENKSQFTTDYAAESPEEDIAESWTFFVLNDKPDSPAIKARKVRFFYQFPELVQLREQIRSRVDFIPKNYLARYMEQQEIDEL